MNYNIVICSDNNYIKYAGVLLYSIVKNTADRSFSTNDSFIFHIFIDSISNENSIKIKELELELQKVCNCGIHIYHISENQFKGYKTWGESNGLTTYLRLLVPEILSDQIDKVLYLDCDILCVNDIREIFYFNLNNNIVAAVPDPWIGRRNKFTFKSKKIVHFNLHLNYRIDESYFNAGVLLIDCKKWRESNITDSLLEVLHNYTLPLNDQDALNIVLKDRTKLIPFNWNFIAVCNNNVSGSSYTEFFECKNAAISELIRPFINTNISRLKLLHFAGKPKPWHSIFSYAENGTLKLIDSDIYKLYCKYAINTPVFCDNFTIIQRDLYQPDFDAHIEAAVNSLGRCVKIIAKKQKIWYHNKAA